MKKYVFRLMLLSLCPLWMASCSSSDDPAPTPPTETALPSPAYADVAMRLTFENGVQIGDRKLHEVQFTESGMYLQTLSDLSGYSAYTFEDNTYVTAFGHKFRIVSFDGNNVLVNINWDGNEYEANATKAASAGADTKTNNLCRKWKISATELTYTIVINTGLRVQDKTSYTQTFTGCDFQEMEIWVAQVAKEQPIIGATGSSFSYYTMTSMDEIDFTHFGTVVFRQYYKTTPSHNKGSWSWKDNTAGVISTSWIGERTNPIFDNGSPTVSFDGDKLIMQMQSGILTGHTVTFETFYYRLSLKFTLSEAK